MTDVNGSRGEQFCRTQQIEIRCSTPYSIVGIDIVEEQPNVFFEHGCYNAFFIDRDIGESGVVVIGEELWLIISKEMSGGRRFACPRSKY